MLDLERHAGVGTQNPTVDIIFKQQYVLLAHVCIDNVYFFSFSLIVLLK